MKLFYFFGTRKPNFKNIKFLDYNDYWRHRGIKLRKKLRAREKIFIDWVRPGTKVLDIACGDAPVLLELKNKKNCHVTGFDISELILNEQSKASVHTQKRDISSDDFILKENYDYIIMSEVLEHLVFPEKLIAKIKNKANYLIISIPNSAFYRYRLSLLFKGRFFTQWAYHPAEHLRFWSHTDFVDWLLAMGLKIVDVKASNGLTFGPIKLFNLNKNLFGYQICYLVKNK